MFLKEKEKYKKEMFVSISPAILYIFLTFDSEFKIKLKIDSIYIKEMIIFFFFELTESSPK